MYKVFYNERTVFFTDSDLNYLEREDNKIHYFKNKSQLKAVLNIFLGNEKIKNLFIVSKDIDKAFRKFSRLYKNIEAAGGLVKNKNQEMLFIYRRNKWDLPKGKLEKKELPELGAIREVEEECGIKDLEILRLLEITYHTYRLKNRDILKKTYWYEMAYAMNQKPVPQTEEDITEVKWIKPKEIYSLMQNTYPSIIDVLKKSEIL